MKMTFNILTFLVVFIVLWSIHVISEPVDPPQKDAPSYLTEFYDEIGNCLFSLEGKKVSVNPNFFSEYDKTNFLLPGEHTSSVITVDIDGSSIESDGSTVLWADSRLQQCDFENICTTESVNKEQDSSILQTINIDEYLESINNECGSKAVIILSQLGNPICMYVGNDVDWWTLHRLPETSGITIDGMDIYIHEGKFVIIDTSLLNKRIRQEGENEK